MKRCLSISRSEVGRNCHSIYHLSNLFLLVKIAKFTVSLILLVKIYKIFILEVNGLTYIYIYIIIIYTYITLIIVCVCVCVCVRVRVCVCACLGCMYMRMHPCMHVCVMLPCSPCTGGGTSQSGVGLGTLSLGSSQPILSTVGGGGGGGGGIAGQPFQLQRPPLGKKRGTATT